MLPIALLAGLSMLLASAQMAASSRADHVASEAVATVESFFRATTPSEVAKHGRLAARGAIFVRSNGRVATEEQFAAELAVRVRKGGEARLNAVSVRLYRDSAVMNARIDWPDGNRSIGAERITVVLIRQKFWQIVAYQASVGEGTREDPPTLVAGPVDAGRHRAADDDLLARLPSRITMLFATGDDAGYRNLLGDEFVRIGADGSMLTKTPSASRFVANKSKPIEPSGVSGLRVSRFGNVAVVTNDETRVGADGRLNPSRFLRVFVRRHGMWQLILAHQTMIAS